MNGRYEIILAGSGGQGLVVSGRLLAEAAILEGFNVVQTQSYGIAQRGGLSQTELILDRNEIIFQQVQKPDAVIALNESAVQKYSLLADSVPVIFDCALTATKAGPHLLGLTLSELAAGAGNPNAANMVALGALLAALDLISLESLTIAIRTAFARTVAEVNLAAVQAGYKAVKNQQAKGGRASRVWKV